MRTSWCLFALSGLVLAAALAISGPGTAPVLLAALLACAAAWLAALYDSRQRARRWALIEASHRQSRLLMAALETLALALEARAPVWEGRIRRMRAYARSCARSLGLGPDECDHLDVAVLLRGISGIEPADSADLAPVAGILKGSGLPDGITAMVAHKSEHFDGSGAPDRLMGMEIPLGARILAAVEVLEALSTHPTRPGDPERLRGPLTAMAGTRLDPRVVESLLETSAANGDIEPAPGSGSPSEASRAGRPELQEALDRITATSLQVCTIREVSRALDRPLDSRESFNLVVDRLERLTRWDTCALYLVDAEQSLLHAREARGAEAPSILQVSIPLGRGVTGRAAAGQVTRSALRTSEADADADAEDADPGPARAGATLAVPLVDGDRVIGCLTLYRNAPAPFGSREARVLEMLAGGIASFFSREVDATLREAGALIDADSGLPTARYLRICFDGELARSRAQCRPLSLLRIEIRGFDILAAREGERAAGRIVGLTARSIRSNLRVVDTCARITGGTFVALLPGMEGDEACRLGLRLRLSVDAHGGAIPIRGPLSIAVGEATAPEDGASLEALLQAASGRLASRREPAIEREARAADLCLPAAEVV